MGFPFLAPLKKEIEDKLKLRERNFTTSNQLKPFAFLTTGAVVIKSNGQTQKERISSIKKLLINPKYPNVATTYYGCVIANTNDINKLYQTGDTIVGYDLNGNPILVEGEKNRRVSVPIITKIDIDTDGGNNTLKLARVDVKVFTLKQLEMFELFFLRPSMSVVLEYGWNSDILKRNTNIETYLFAKKNWSNFEKDYLEIFSKKPDKKETAQENPRQTYLKILKETNYDYDYMAGTVTNFTISPDTDGTYNIMIEISTGNELQLWPPKDQGKSTGSTQQPNVNKNAGYNTFPEFIDKISTDLGSSIVKNVFSEKNTDGSYKWKNDLYNFGVYNKSQKDTTGSKKPYISMKFIIELLNTIRPFSSKQKIIEYTYFEDDQTFQKPVIPVMSREMIISTNEDLIIPGDLPKIVVGKDENNQNAILVDTINLEDGNINGKSFNFKESIKTYDFQNKKEIKPNAETILYKKNGEKYKQTSIGNLLNIFISYELFLSIWKQSTTLAEIINPIFDVVNQNMFGLVKIELQKPDDIPTLIPLEVIDRKLATIPSQDGNEPKTYRFKVNSIDSIVKNFEFNMELSTLMQAQALYATQLAVTKAKVNKDSNKPEDQETEPVAERDEYSSADLSYHINQDGYVSINHLQNRLVEQYAQDSQPPKPDEVKADVLTDTIQQKYVKFKKDPFNQKEKPKNLIYLDTALIQKELKPKWVENSTALTYLDISLAIDGISGLSCGEYFHIEGIPEIYNTNGYFQITNVKQLIDENGWDTSIEAGYRIKT